MNVIKEKTALAEEEFRGIVRHVEPQIEVEKRRVVRRVKKQKKKGLYSLQGLLMFSFTAVFGILFGQLYIDSQVSKLHYETERLKLEISEKAIENDQLFAEISELSMYSRVVEIAQEKGLDYQDNIIAIGE